MPPTRSVSRSGVRPKDCARRARPLAQALDTGLAHERAADIVGHGTPAGGAVRGGGAGRDVEVVDQRAEGAVEVRQQDHLGEAAPVVAREGAGGTVGGEHHVEHDATVRRVLPVAMAVPVGARPVDLHITDPQEILWRRADAERGVREVGSRALVERSRVEHDDGLAVRGREGARGVEAPRPGILHDGLRHTAHRGIGLSNQGLGHASGSTEGKAGHREKGD